MIGGSIDTAVHSGAVGRQPTVAQIVHMVAVGVAVAHLMAVDGGGMIPILVAVGVAQTRVAAG